MGVEEEKDEAAERVGVVATGGRASASGQPLALAPPHKRVVAPALAILAAKTDARPKRRWLILSEEEEEERARVVIDRSEVWCGEGERLPAQHVNDRSKAS